MFAEVEEAICLTRIPCSEGLRKTGVDPLKLYSLVGVNDNVLRVIFRCVIVLIRIFLC